MVALSVATARIRPLAEILADDEVVSAPGGGVSHVVHHQLDRIIGAEAATALVTLHGVELSADVCIDLSEWDHWDDFGFAEEFDENPGLRLVAFSGCGDAWAIDAATGNVVFIHHDLPDPRVDLWVRVPEFVQLADLWGQLERIDEDADPQQRREAFGHLATPLLPTRFRVAPGSWPWPYL